MIVIALFVIMWFGMGIYGSACGYNYLETEHPQGPDIESETFIFACCASVIGPFNLVGVLLSGFTAYGPRFHRFKYINGVRQP